MPWQRNRKKPLAAKGRFGGKGRSFDRWIIVGIIVALIAIALSLWGPLRKYRPGTEKNGRGNRPNSRNRRQARNQRRKNRCTRKNKGTEDRQKTGRLPVARPAEKTAFIAIVIDDLGQDLRSAQEILALPGKITVAVMPGLPQSKKVAELAKQNKREVLLHLPMEYRGKNGKPAPGMLRSDHDTHGLSERDQRRRRFRPRRRSA